MLAITNKRKHKLVFLSGISNETGHSLAIEFASKSYIVCGIASKSHFCQTKATKKLVVQMQEELSQISSTSSLFTDNFDSSNDEKDIDLNVNMNDFTDGIIDHLLFSFNDEKENEITHNVERINLRNEIQVGLYIITMLKKYGIPDIVLHCTSMMIADECNDKKKSNENNQHSNRRNIHNLTYDEFVDVFDTNVLAYFHILKYILPSLMKRRSGLVVHISEGLLLFVIVFICVCIHMCTELNDIPNMFASAYHTSNYVIEGMVQSLVNDVIFSNKLQKMPFLRKTDIMVIALSHCMVDDIYAYSEEISEDKNYKKKKGNNYKIVEETEFKSEKMKFTDIERKILLSNWASETVSFLEKLLSNHNRSRMKNKKKKRLKMVEKLAEGVKVVQLIDFHHLK